MLAILDPFILLLLLLAVWPPRRVPALVRGLIRWRWVALALGLGVFACVAFITSARAFLPVLVSLGALLTGVLYPVGELIAGLADTRRPWRRWATLLGVAGLWSARLGLMLPPVDPGVGTPWWFVDFFNRCLFFRAAPGLDAMGAGEVMPALAGYLSAPFFWLSGELLALGYVVSVVGAYILYHVLKTRMERLPPPPTLLDRRPPIGGLLAAGGLVLAGTLWPQTPALPQLASIAGALVVARGIGLALVATVDHRLGRYALLVGVVTMVVHPVLWWAPAILTALDAVVGLSDRLAAPGGPWHRWQARVVRTLDGFSRRIFRVLLLTIVLLSLFMAGLFRVPPAKDALARLGPSPSGPPSKGMVRMDMGDAGRVDIDRYEFPNRARQMPSTGLLPDEAELQCAAEGKRLCTSAEWYLACSEGGTYLYVAPRDPRRQTHVQKRPHNGWVHAARVCNLGRTDTGAALAPSGTYRDCVGPSGVHDLLGNAFEWVRAPEYPGFWALAGSYYGFADNTAARCAHRVLLHPSQASLIGLAGVGFRCCR